MSQTENIPSPARLLEDGILLAGPNAPHAEIGQKGRGRFSVWQGYLIFSTSDGSDPRTNGRHYELYWPTLVRKRWLFACYGLLLVLTLALPSSIWLSRKAVLSSPLDAARLISRETFSKFRSVEERLGPRTRIRLIVLVVVCWLVLSMLAAILTLQWAGIYLLGWQYTPIAVQNAQPYPELGPNAYEISLSTAWMSQTESFQSPARLFEDGILLPRPNALHVDIGQKGRGRYSLWQGYLIFSTSDGSDPRTNGRRYELYWPTPVDGLWLLANYGLVLMLTLVLAAWVQLQRHSGVSGESSRVLLDKWEAIRKLLTAEGQMGAPTRARLAQATAIIWLISTVGAILLCLHSLAIVPLKWERKPLARIAHLEGYAYTAPLEQRWTDLYGASAEVPGTIYEGGLALPFHVSTGYADVAQEGMGRYYVQPDMVYFSASDNTDPTANGRRYELLRPTPLSVLSVLGMWALALLTSIMMGVRYRRAIVRLVTQPPFYLAAGIFALPFLISRLWIYLDYPLAGIHPDSGSYFAIAEQIGSGVWPKFWMRPPLYPLLMKLVFSICDRAMALAAVQTVLSFISGLCMVYAVHRLRKSLAIPAALAMAGYFYSVTAVEQDTSLLSESPYTSCLILSFAFLLVGLSVGGKRLSFALSSAAMAAAIMTRPQGSFLLVTYGLVVGFMLWNRYAGGLTIAFIVPLPALLLSLMAYNYFTADSFATTNWGEANLAVGTFTFWEGDPRYPLEVNATIENIQRIIDQRFNLEKLDRRLLYTSWNPEALAFIFRQGFNAAALDRAMMLGGAFYDSRNRGWIRTIAIDSIKKHPVIYVKFVFTMLCLYYHSVWSGSDFDFRAYLMNRAWLFYVDKHFARQKGNGLMVRLGKEFADGAPPKTVTIFDYGEGVARPISEEVMLAATPSWRAYYALLRVRRAIFANILWSVVFLAMFVLSTVGLVKSRGRERGRFILFILTVSVVGASMVVSLVELSQPRYSYPMEWVYYLSVVLLPLAMGSRKSGGPRRA
jgi:hypothetical protein